MDSQFNSKKVIVVVVVSNIHTGCSYYVRFVTLIAHHYIHSNYTYTLPLLFIPYYYY